MKEFILGALTAVVIIPILIFLLVLTCIVLTGIGYVILFGIVYLYYHIANYFNS